MPWTAKSPPRPAKNWSAPAKALCARVANAVLKQSGKEDQAIYACIRAVKLKYPDQIGGTKKNEYSEVHVGQAANIFFADIFDIGSITFETEGEGESERHVTKGLNIAVGGKFVHPFWGEVDLSDSVLNEMKRNHDKKVLGTDVAIDERHDRGRALGWIKPGSLKRTKVTLHGKDYSALTGDVAWTPAGRQLLEDKTYKYFSPEFGTYTEPDGKTEHHNVLVGGALTNRPFLKMMPAIKFDEGQATDVMVLDDGTEDDELWELEDGTKEVLAFSVGFHAFDPESGDNNDEDDMAVAELIAKAKSLGLEVSDEASLEKALEQMTTRVKGDKEIREKLKEAGIEFADETPTEQVVVGAVSTFASAIQNLTTLVTGMQKKSLEDEATTSVQKLIDVGKVQPKQFDEFVKLYKTDKALFESLTKSLVPVIQYGEIGGPGILADPGQDNTTDMREFQDPAKAEAKALEYLEKNVGLTPKSKQTEPVRFDPNGWRRGHHVSEARR